MLNEPPQYNHHWQWGSGTGHGGMVKVEVMAVQTDDSTCARGGGVPAHPLGYPIQREQKRERKETEMN